MPSIGEGPRLDASPEHDRFDAAGGIMELVEWFAEFVGG